ncbi:MAG: LysM peptidoglycan-binding domain-containing protein [Clostridiales bacterium]|nr:LysM peptidoglycan-binding domain-containing protein [Clostridiales bacterium]
MKSAKKVRYKIISKSRFILFLAIPIIIIFSIFLGMKVNAKNETDPVCESIYVESGDTLWSISSKYAPNNMDLRLYIDKVMEINDIETAILRPGQMLYVPVL